MVKPNAAARVAPASGGVECESLHPRWDGPIIVAATGESLTKEVAEQCRGHRLIAIKQAALRMPWADAMYACDAHHWNLYQGYPQFTGERWSSHSSKSYDNKLEVAQKYGLRLVWGRHGDTFSTDPVFIHYGNSAGFHAIGLAVHWLRKPGRLVLVGFDMKGGYFYGHHPRGAQLANQIPAYMPFFERASKRLPEGVEVVTGTPSALTCFPQMSLADALA